MEKFKGILKNIFCLPPIHTVCIAVPSLAFVVLVFAAGLKNTVLAYGAYIASAYGTIIIVTGFPGIVKAVKKWIEEHPLKKKIESYPLGKRFIKDVVFRTKISLYQGMIINLVYVAINLFWGVFYRSSWFIALAVYFIFLAIMRFLLLRYVNKNRTLAQKNMVSEFRRYGICGVLLLLMNQALGAIVMLMVNENRGYDYPGLQIYLMAIYAFYAVIIATVNLIRFRKHGSPVMSAAKVINLTAALVSILSLETAMLAQFGAADGAEFRNVMIGATGVGVCIIVFGMAVFMIVRATRNLRQLKNNIS